MKRFTALLLSLALLFCLIPLGVVAEGDFKPEVTASYQAEDGMVVLTWMTAGTAGYTLKEVSINSNAYGSVSTSVSGGKATAKVKETQKLEAGTYMGTCTFEAESASAAVKEQTADFTLKLTDADLLGFTFSDPQPGYNASNEVFSLNYAGGNAGVRLARVQIDGKQILNVTDNGGRVNGSIGKLDIGSHRLTYYFTAANGATVTFQSKKTLDIAGTIALKLSVGVEGDLIVATLKDEDGNPVADYMVDLYVSGQKLRNNKTDAAGRVVFDVAAPADRTTVRCSVTGGRVGVITYTGAEAWLQTPSSQPPTTTTTKPKTTTTGGVTTDTTGDDDATTTGTGTGTTGTRYPVVTGAATTSLQGDMVAVSVTFDTGISTAFGLSDKDFGDRVRLLMPADFYDTLINGSQATVMLSMRSSDKKVSPPDIAASIAGNSRFNGMNAEDAKSITMDLSALFISLLDHSEADLSMPAADMKMQIPVPENMKDRVLGIAVNTDDGLSQLVEVTPEDGVITVALNRLATVTLVGFVNPGTPEGGGVPWLVIVLIVVGVLLLGGAGVLVYFFLIRKPKEEDDPDGDGPDDGNPEGEGPDGDRPDGPQDPDGEEPPEDGLPEDAVSEDNGWASGEEMNSDGTDGNTRVIPNVNGAASPVSDATQVIGGVSLGAFAERPANDPSRPKR